MRTKAFNPQILLESLCFGFFGGLMLHLVHSGKYLSYVTPAMAPYLYFTAFVMLLWSCAGLVRIFRPQHIIRSAHCFVLAIPVLLFLLPHGPLNASDLAGNYIGGNTFSNRTGQSSGNSPQEQAPADNTVSGAAASPTETDALPAESPAGNDLPAEAGEPADSIPITIPDTQATLPEEPEETLSAHLPGLDEANKKITVSNDDFGLWLSELYMNMEKYEGYTVIMTGFVFKDSEMLKADEFVPARLMMSCCVADLSPAGLVCKYDKVADLKQDSWVTVEGTLFIGVYQYDGQQYDDPQIQVTKITPAAAVEGYVYPY